MTNAKFLIGRFCFDFSNRRFKLLFETVVLIALFAGGSAQKDAKKRVFLKLEK
jgi:hypothetical protein